MTDNSSGYQQVQDLVSRIRNHTGYEMPVFKQLLEPGAAEKAGAIGYLALISVHDTIALFSLENSPETPVVEDVIAHATSAEACMAIILVPGCQDIWIPCNTDDIPEWGRELYKSSLQYKSGLSTYNIPSQKADPCESLSHYLSDIRRELNGWYYHREGETSESVRDLTVQCLMNQVILRKIFHAHYGNADCGNELTLKASLITFASTLPVHDQYTSRPADIESAESGKMVSRLVSLPSSELVNLRLSWIQPETWAKVFGRHLGTCAKKQRKQASMSNPLHRGAPVLVSDTHVGKLVIEILADQIGRFFPGTICDPSAGCGHLIARILRIIRMKHAVSGDTDTIISRLIIAGDTIYATDSSAIHTLTIRLVIIIWVIGGEILHPLLSLNPLWYPCMKLNDHLQTGSALYGKEIVSEFVSERAGQQILRYLHPIDTTDLVPAKKQFSLIISVPDGSLPMQIPEVTGYLTKTYQSFHQGISPAALYTERISYCTVPGGATVIFLPSGWISEISYREFRRWMATRLPATVILENNASGRVDLKEISAIILKERREKTLQVIRIQRSSTHGNVSIKDYTIPAQFLSGEDGWRLDDPWEEQMLRFITKGSMTLSSYLFDELYPGDAIQEKKSSAEGWTSLIYSEGIITIQVSNHPIPQALAIIPGRDKFLIGLLHSSLIRWYMQVTTGRESSENRAVVNIIRNLPIESFDHYAEDECRMQSEVERAVERITFLTRLKSTSHSWHDQSRINRQISFTQGELDQQIFRLYHISESDGQEILRRVMNTASAVTQTKGIQIF